MKKINILQISPDGKLYGTERHILSIVKHSDKDRFEHSVAIPSPGNFNDELDNIGVIHHTAGRLHGYENKFADLAGEGTKKLLRLIKNGNYDIVHTHLNAFGGFVGKLSGANAVIHTRHGVFWSEEELKSLSSLGKTFQKFKSVFFDMTIAIGEYEKRTLVEKFGYDPQKIRVTINGVDVQQIRSKLTPNYTKQKLFGTDELIVGAVGRLERQKGFHYFLEAAYCLKNKFPNIRFVIIGDGSCKEDLMLRAKKYGLEEKVSFISYRQNILDYVNCFDINVSTSLWEGMSYSVQEAMALGKPVIALTSKNVSGLSEIIVKNKTGFLIEEDYVNNLTKQIGLLASDSALRNEFGKASEERERVHFPEQRTAEDMDKVYEEVYLKKKRTL